MNEHTSLRDLWTFQYKANEVAQAAKAQSEYRASRKEWWAQKKREIMDKIRTDGVNITESLADQLAALGASPKLSYHTQAAGPQVRIDPALSAQLQEAHNKIDTHHRAMIEYDGWYQVLSAPATREKTLELTQTDWLYFFSRGTVSAVQ